MPLFRRRTNESPSESYSLQSQITKATRANGVISLLFTGARSVEKQSQFSNDDYRKLLAVDADFEDTEKRLSIYANSGVSSVKNLKFSITTTKLQCRIYTKLKSDYGPSISQVEVGFAES
ncbi:hypothetical protein K0M31_017541 [Melipona bicolor]|uniref:Uncharacterized protein n=1 Tax=Melipona bicolor TaxID=60889 RepID=A0AA40G5A1_9HYME|nr:hypothetical protein K0M31_017541 [Melipona bicolor]